MYTTHSVDTATSKTSPVTKTQVTHVVNATTGITGQIAKPGSNWLDDKSYMHAFAIEAIRMKPEMTKARLAAAQVCCWCQRLRVR